MRKAAASHEQPSSRCRSIKPRAVGAFAGEPETAPLRSRKALCSATRPVANAGTVQWQIAVLAVAGAAAGMARAPGLAPASSMAFHPKRSRSPSRMYWIAGYAARWVVPAMTASFSCSVPILRRPMSLGLTDPHDSADRRTNEPQNWEDQPPHVISCTCIAALSSRRANQRLHIHPDLLRVACAGTTCHARLTEMQASWHLIYTRSAPRLQYNFGSRYQLDIRENPQINRVKILQINQGDHCTLQSDLA